MGDFADAIQVEDLLGGAAGDGTCSISTKLDFTDCILDSPHFRSSLRQKYCTFEEINSHFKLIIKNALALKEQQKKSLAAFQVLLQSIKEHPVPQGDDLTQDENTAYNAVYEFVDMMQKQEERSQRVQETGLDALVAGLQTYQKTYNEAVREDFKKFKKATEKYCHSQEKYLSISTKKGAKSISDQSGPSAHAHAQSQTPQMPPNMGTGTLEEMDRTMMADTTMFLNVSTEIVWNVLENEERARLGFIQYMYEFTRTYLASFIWGYLENVKKFQGYYPFLEETLSSSQKQLLLTAEEAQALRSHILKDPQLAMEQKKQLYDKQGYLWVYESSRKKMIVSAAAHASLSSPSTKYFCQYRNKERQLTMTQYHQVNPPKNLTVEFYTVKQCCRRATSESERQFLFDVTLFNIEKGQIQMTMQAQSNEERAQWLNVMEGEEPIYEDYRKFQSLGIYELDARGLEFIDFMIASIEREGGLETEGAFRRPGGAKRVNELLEAFFVMNDVGPIMNDPSGIEVKTLTSALKRFLTELKEPLIPYHLYYKLINVAKTCDSKEEQLECVHSIIHQLPKNHFVALKKLVQHLNRIVAHSEQTKMNAVNLSTCVGTSLLHSEGKSIANVMEIKFVNQIVLLILNNYHKIFETSPVPFGSASKSIASSSSRVSNEKMDLEGARKAMKVRSSSVDSLADSPSGGEQPVTPTASGGNGGAAGSTFKRGNLRSSLKNSKNNSRPSSLNTASSNRIKNSPSANQISPTELSNESSPNNPCIHNQTTLSSSSAASAHVDSSLLDIEKMNPFGPKNTCVRTLFDCTGDPNADELSFHAHQVIVNVSLSEEPGWLRGTLNGREGLFPANYCQVVDPLECFKDHRYQSFSL